MTKATTQNYEFDGVNWKVYRDPSPNHDYIMGYRGVQFLETIGPANIYCPYIPLYATSSKQI